MRAALLLCLPGSLAACGQSPGEAARNEIDSAAVPGRTVDQGGRILDLAGVLSGDERFSLARRLAGEQQADGRPVIVVLVRPERGDSLERIGWAVTGAGQRSDSILMLVDPASGRVRIEGDLAPEGRAEVAAAMRDDLRAGRTAVAVGLGLTRLEELAP